MNENWENLVGAVPVPPAWAIDWGALARTPLAPYMEEMSSTMQNPAWHGEGDVLTHTRMVCEALVGDEEFRALPEDLREIVFIAALLHDIGKIPCTRLEDGVLKSPNHTIVGAGMARELLWRECGLAGNVRERNIRECICALIRFHSVPMHIAEQKDAERRLFAVAAQGELIPDFNIELLLTLVRADMKGRIYADMEDSLETVELCRELAEELGILREPGQFAAETTKYAYLNRRDVWREQVLYDDTWGEVILMCGLPGTGKDTWARRHCAELPVISLDGIRKEAGLLPGKDYGAVWQTASARAKEFLRKQESFVWNATNLGVRDRAKVLRLAEQYHARVRIIFLETGWEEELRRNAGRPENQIVPEHKIRQMLRKLEPPAREEARAVEWHCV